MELKNNKFELIHQDENYIFVNKSSGTLSIPDRYNTNLPNLKTILDDIFGEVYVVHRLDKDTSGIIMFAKNPEAHKFMNELFENQKIERIYHVISKGAFPFEEIDIDIPLLPNASDKNKVIPSARGKYSLTKIQLLQKFRFISLLRCELMTGRQHQIRVHLAAIGHPLLVDPLYSDNSEFYLSQIKKNYNTSKNEDNEKPLINRLSMHAYSLKFEDIFTNKEIYITVPYPKDFEIVLKQLKKFSSINI